MKSLCSVAVLLSVGIFCLIQSGLAKRQEDIRRDGSYIVSWESNKVAKTVTFEVTVRTTGFVGFGISKNGGMAGADIVIGGVSDGAAYFSDRHASENGYPPEDTVQNWNLLEASENNTHTYLKFERELNTCDSEDVEITEDTIRFIWSIGENDNIGYHGVNRGSFAVTILSEPYPEYDLSMYNTFDAVTNVTMPTKETTYWCTVHKAPIFSGYQHAVAFGPVLKGELSERHSHHLSLYSCKTPSNEDPLFFDRFVIQGGIDCLDREPGQISAYPYCTELIYTWTIGGRIMHMPENIGFPIGQEEHMYYLMESHFDNPQRLSEVNFESGVRIYYTDELRPTEAGVIRIGQHYSYNFVVPPNSKDYKVVGHCSSNCTKEWIPQTGVDIFNAMLHSHAFGTKMRFRQFRNGTELPWIINDENYDNNYQDNRNIEAVKLLPGDQLAIECNYDNTWLNPPGTVIGGFGTREEMCEVVFYYYPRTQLENCRSNIPFSIILAYFGIESVRSVDSSTNPVITAPASLARRRFLEYVDSLYWTEESRRFLERMMRYGSHEEVCGGDGFQRSSVDNDIVYITYPEIDREYTPPGSGCPNVNG